MPGELRGSDLIQVNEEGLNKVIERMKGLLRETLYFYYQKL